MHDTPPCTTHRTSTRPSEQFPSRSVRHGGGLYNPLGNYAYNPCSRLRLQGRLRAGLWPLRGLRVGEQIPRPRFPVRPITGTVRDASRCNGDHFRIRGAFNDSSVGGGGGANARWAFSQRKLMSAFTSSAAPASGAMARADCRTPRFARTAPSLCSATIRLSARCSFIPTPKLDIYMNVGGEYRDRAAVHQDGGAARTRATVPTLNNSGCWTETLPVTGPSTGSNTGVPTGVGGSTGFIPGPLASCTGDTAQRHRRYARVLVSLLQRPEGKLPIRHAVFQLRPQHLAGRGERNRERRRFTTSGQPHSDENMVFTSFRYYLP